VVSTPDNSPVPGDRVAQALMLLVPGADPSLIFRVEIDFSRGQVTVTHRFDGERSAVTRHPIRST
jgi:hypothetical protein